MSVNPEATMPQSAALYSQADAERLEAATDEAIAACGGDTLNNSTLLCRATFIRRGVERADVKSNFAPARTGTKG